MGEPNVAVTNALERTRHRAVGELAAVGDGGETASGGLHQRAADALADIAKWTYQFCSGVNGGTATCLSGASYLIQETPYAYGGTTVNGSVLTVYFDALERELGRDTQGPGRSS